MKFNRTSLILFSALAALLLPAVPGLAAPAANFAGVREEGSRVAFVCDGSRWTKNKIDDLEDALVKAVDGFSPDQQFSVVFFADGTASGPADGKMLPATDDNKRLVRNWFLDFKFGRNSTPVVGLDRAFALNPDAIYVVSDGQFDDYDGVLKRVLTLNPDRAVRVHAVGFFATEKEDSSRRFVRFMRRLAEENGGQFRAVYADELKPTR